MKNYDFSLPEPQLQDLYNSALTMSTSELMLSRRIATQYLYALDFTKQSEFKDRDFQDFAEQFEMPTQLFPYIKSLVFLIFINLDKLDELIKANSLNWKFFRIAKVDLAILRVCVAEYLIRKLEVKIFISDGAEMAEELGTKNSYAFIHGVLHGVGLATAAI